MRKNVCLCNTGIRLLPSKNQEQRRRLRPDESSSSGSQTSVFRYLLLYVCGLEAVRPLVPSARFGRVVREKFSAGGVGLPVARPRARRGAGLWSDAAAPAVLELFLILSHLEKKAKFNLPRPCVSVCLPCESRASTRCSAGGGKFSGKPAETNQPRVPPLVIRAQNIYVSRVIVTWYDAEILLHRPNEPSRSSVSRDLNLRISLV